VQICSEAPKGPHRLRVSLCRYGYIMFGITDVDTSGIPIQFGKAILPILLLPLSHCPLIHALRHITVLILLEIGLGPARL
jgi:hypothetical protein